MKISFDTFKKLLTTHLRDNCCQEILFKLENSEKYNHCWMGVINKNGSSEYWFGLTSDGKEAYDYTNFDQMTSAPVFNGKSLKEIWDTINILSINGCSPESMIPFYL